MSAQTIADNAAAGAGPVDRPGVAVLRASAPVARTRIPDDKDMLRAAVEQTRDLLTARPAIYWPDMLGSALLGYAGLAGAILLTTRGQRWRAGCCPRWRCTARCCSSTN